MKRLKRWWGNRKAKQTADKNKWWTEDGVNSYLTPKQRAEYEARWAEIDAKPNAMPKIPEKPVVMEIDTGIVPVEWTETK